MFLQDKNIIDLLLSLNPTITITFIYNKKEYGIDKSIKWILEHATEKDKKRLAFYALPDETFIDYTVIVCQPGFVINVLYEEVKDNKQHCLLKEISDISFDSTKIAEAFKRLLNISKDAV